MAGHRRSPDLHRADGTHSRPALRDRATAPQSATVKAIYLGAAVLVATGALATAPARAQDRPLELTVLGGLRLGGQFDDAVTGYARSFDEDLALGLSLGFPLGNVRTLEVVWTHAQLGAAAGDDGGAVDLRLDTLGISGTYEWGDGKSRPFVFGTVGLALLSPRTSGYDSELLLGGTLGGGVKVPLSARVGFRVEGRGMALLATGGAAGVCGGGACALAFSGAGILELELLAGLSFSF